MNSIDTNKDMTEEEKKKKKKRNVIIIILIIILFILFLILLYCRLSKESSSKIVDMDTIKRLDYIFEPAFLLNAKMFISDGPGTPEGTEDTSANTSTQEKPNIPSYKSYKDKLESSSEEISKEQARLSRKYNPNPYKGKLDSTAAEIVQAERYLGVNRDAILNVNNIIKITNPKAGMILEAGTDFVLTWETTKSIVNNKDIKISILFSSDGGKNYKVIADTMDNKTEYKFIVPDELSNNCIIRIQISKIGDQEIYVGVNSEVFSIVESKIKINSISDIIKITNPKTGMVLEAGKEFILQWNTKNIENNKISKISILFSSDGGKNYKVISDWINNKNEYKLIVPDSVSDNCIFRIQVNKIGDAEIYTGVNSPIFSISAAQEPDVVEETPPPKYTDKSGTFVSSQFGDSVRWIKVEHELENVESVIWQLSKVAFPNNIDSPFDVPGLLAHGELSGNIKEFKMDFDAIYKGIDEGKIPEDNKGSDFEVEPNAVQLNQWNYTAYVRVLMVDKDNNVVGATVSNYIVGYGKPRVVAHATKIIDIDPHPYLTTINPLKNDKFFKEFPTGIALYSGGNTTWKFSLNKIPLSSYGIAKPYLIEYQVSTIPFSIQEDLCSDDYMNPPGLVYKSKKTTLQSTVTETFSIPFDEFVPKSEGSYQLAKRTYYIRAVMYYNGTPSKIYTQNELNEGVWDDTSYVALATKGDVVIYTTSYSIFESINNSAALVGVPEEVTVKSYVPDTRIVGYDPPRGYVSKPEEYFEVTRRITPDEWGFWLTNNATGEKLNPYSWHKQNQNMTKEEYQKKLDRMVPVGAEFHVKPKSKNFFEKVIGDFFDLLEQIYKSVQNAYNGLKAKLINTLSEGFGKVFGGKAFFDKVFTYLADYGLMYIGLPPSLPNSDILALESMDYIVRVAMDEAAKATGVPLDDLPIDLREKVVSETEKQFKNMRSRKSQSV